MILGPSGYQALSHPQAELATARAAERLGTVMGLSTSSNFSIEDVGAITRDPWFQLYWFSDEGVTRDMIERAAAAGFAAIALTVDAPTDLWREGEMRDPIDIPDGVLSVNLPDRPLTRASHVTWKRTRLAALAQPDEDPAQGCADGRGRDPGRGPRRGRPDRVEPRRARARLVDRVARCAARRSSMRSATGWRSTWMAASGGAAT